MKGVLLNKWTGLSQYSRSVCYFWKSDTLHERLMLVSRQKRLDMERMIKRVASSAPYKAAPDTWLIGVMFLIGLVPHK